MKRTLLNLGAILAAFLIGLAINNACADSLENMSDTELRKLVAQLQQELNSLKERVAQLEKSNGNSSSGREGYIGKWNLSLNKCLLQFYTKRGPGPKPEPCSFSICSIFYKQL